MLGRCLDADTTQDWFSSDDTFRALPAVLCLSPRFRELSWSVSGSTMILNRVWEGNEIYILVALYAGIGLGLVAGGVFAWKGSRKAQTIG